MTGRARLPQPPPAKLRLEAEGEEKLLIGRLRGMLNNPLLSDLCLLCKDGVKVHACRVFLMASSDVFRQMLSNGMAESSMLNISLLEISSSALLPTLEYLYTGSITQHEMDLGTAFCVFHAATFFNVHTLEARLKSLFPPLISSMGEFPAILAQHLSTLEDHGLTPLLDDVVSGIMLRLRRHCCAAHPSAFLRHLSTCGMVSLADSLRSRNEHATVFSFMEYICFRSLLIWGASHITTEAVDFFERALPEEDMLAAHLDALRSSGKSFLEVGLDREKTETGGLLTAKEVKYVEDLKEFLGKKPWKLKEIELVRIHPIILVMVLKPLNILDSARFVEAVEYQALHMGEMNLMKWVLPQGESSLPYTREENGAVLCVQKSSTDKQVASPRAFVNMSFSNPIGFHEMSFIVENVAQEIRIFVFSSGGNAKAGGFLRCEGARFSLFALNDGIRPDQYTEVKEVLSPSVMERGDLIRVVLDMGKQQCAFHIKDGSQLVLENLLEEVFIEGYVSRHGKVRAVLASEIAFV